MQKRFLKASTEKHERGSDSFNMEGVDGGGRNTKTIIPSFGSINQGIENKLNDQAIT